MVWGLETAETNRRRSLSLAPSSLTDAATADAATPLSTLLEGEKNQTDIWRDRKAVNR